MNAEPLFPELLLLVKEVCPHIDVTKLSPQSRLIRDLKVDSFVVTELGMALDRKYEMENVLVKLFMSQDDPENLTLQSVLDLIEVGRVHSV